MSRLGQGRTEAAGTLVVLMNLGPSASPAGRGWRRSSTHFQGWEKAGCPPHPSSCHLHPAGSQGLTPLCSLRFSLARFSGAWTAPQNQIRRGSEREGWWGYSLHPGFCFPGGRGGRRWVMGDEAPWGWWGVMVVLISQQTNTGLSITNRTKKTLGVSINKIEKTHRNFRIMRGKERRK